MDGGGHSDRVVPEIPENYQAFSRCGLDQRGQALQCVGICDIGDRYAESAERFGFTQVAVGNEQDGHFWPVDGRFRPQFDLLSGKFNPHDWAIRSRSAAMRATRSASFSELSDSRSRSTISGKLIGLGRVISTITIRDC